MGFNKSERKEVAQDTLEILGDGEYWVGDQPVTFDNSVKTKFYTEDDLSQIAIRAGKVGTFALANESVIETIHRLYQQYGTDVCVLNFASGYMPCGGWLKGSIAQEEAIAYSSNLYTQQTSKEGWQFYERNRADGSKAYLNNMLLSEVIIFRDEELFPTENPSTVKIVTSPAVHLKRVQREREILAEPVEVIMKRRMRLILNLMIESGCSHIVLGAFGCGAYGNDSNMVATAWRELLVDEGYSTSFDTITFAIPKDRKGNYNTFRSVLDECWESFID